MIFVPRLDKFFQVWSQLLPTLKQLLDEAKEQNLDLKGLVCAVGLQPIEDTLYYKQAMGIMTEKEFNEAFKKWQKGEKNENKHL